VTCPLIIQHPPTFQNHQEQSIYQRGSLHLTTPQSKCVRCSLSSQSVPTRCDLQPSSSIVHRLPEPSVRTLHLIRNLLQPSLNTVTSIDILNQLTSLHPGPFLLCIRVTWVHHLDRGYSNSNSREAAGSIVYLSDLVQSTRSVMVTYATFAAGGQIQ
jgi:hypothetical protein